MLGQVSSGYARIGQVRICYDWLVHVRSGYVRLGHVV